MLRILAIPSLAVCAVLGATGVAPPSPDYDFQWCVVGDVGNPAYAGGRYGEFAGRGSVPYAYRMSKLEVTSAQWLEFVNIFAPLSPNPNQFLMPDISGLQQTAAPGIYELNPKIPDAGMVPVYGISWREAAMYCNWLHNGKAHKWRAIMNGAYDVSTFGSVAGRPGAFTDQVTRSRDAKFWIPSLDEWIKAAHYDPNRCRPGRGGWWLYPYQSDDPPIPGWPGAGQTSAGLPLSPFFDELFIPLGSYPDAHSYYGLLDLSGGGKEWTEETDPGSFHYDRGVDGTHTGVWGDYALMPDLIDQLDYLPPGSAAWTTIRVASSVRTPSAH